MTAQPYTYFVSFAHADGFGDLVVYLAEPICSAPDIDALRAVVKSRTGFDASIQTFALLAEPESAVNRP